MKTAIAQAFAALVTEGSTPHRVTVVDVARRLGIDRKTFYYYFETSDILVQWIFRKAMCSIVTKPEFASATLVYPEKNSHDSFPDLPFYIEVASESDFSYQTLYFKYWGQYFQANREFYKRIFTGTTSFKLFDYITTLYLPAIEQDIHKMLGRRNLPEAVMKFLAEYHTMGIFGRVSYHYIRTDSFMMQRELDPFFSYGHYMLKITLDRCCEDRAER